MRALLFLVAMVPSLAYAASAEDEHYYAVFDNNKVVNIEFRSEDEHWNDKRPIYGSKQAKPFSYCWSTEDQKYFYCAGTKDKTRAVRFKKGPESGATQRAAMKLLKRNIVISETGDLQGYYVCERGCSPDMPRFIFNIGDSGC